MPDTKVPFSAYFREYNGHKVDHLLTIYRELRPSTDRIIWTAGDSSLDNKYWFEDRQAAPGLYASILDPPMYKQDINYWLNHLLSERDPRTAAINTAVEATTLNARTFRLRPQDRFIRDNIQSQDVLVVSVGGNDVALVPLPCTIASIMCSLCLPTVCLENGFTCGVVPLDDCCCGCGASLCSCVCGAPPCFGYLRHLFGYRVQKYIEALTSRTKPRKILVCMIYYPDEAVEPGWAGPALEALGYNRDPSKVQLLIRKFFQEGTSNISVPGTEVIPVPLFHVLDGKTSSDYVQRVEPSPSGGKKMAEYLLDVIDGKIGPGSSMSPPVSSAMHGR